MWPVGLPESYHRSHCGRSLGTVLKRNVISGRSEGHWLIKNNSELSSLLVGGANHLNRPWEFAEKEWKKIKCNGGRERFISSPPTQARTSCFARKHGRRWRHRSWSMSLVRASAPFDMSDKSRYVIRHKPVTSRRNAIEEFMASTSLNETLLTIVDCGIHWMTAATNLILNIFNDCFSQKLRHPLRMLILLWSLTWIVELKMINSVFQSDARSTSCLEKSPECCKENYQLFKTVYTSSIRT